MSLSSFSFYSFIFTSVFHVEQNVSMVNKERKKTWLKNFLRLPYWNKIFVFFFALCYYWLVSTSIHLLVNINTFYIRFQRIIIDTCDARRRRRCFTMLFVVLFVIIQQILQIKQKIIKELDQFNHHRWCHVIITLE